MIIILLTVYVILSFICFWLNETNNCDHSIFFSSYRYYEEDNQKLYYILLSTKTLIMALIIANIVLNYDYMY